MSAAATLRKCVDTLLRGAAVLLVALLGLTSGIALALSTRAGRAHLLELVLAKLNEALPGELAARRLESIGLGSVALQGVRIVAPSGDEVARIDVVEARLALGRLLRGQLALAEVRLEGALVDLRSPSAPHAGFVSAFIDREADPAEASEQGGPLEVQFDAIELRGARVRLPSGPPLMPTELSIALLRGRLRAGAALEVNVDRLEGWLARDGVEMGPVAVRGRYHPKGASRVELKAALCGIQLDASADVQETERLLGEELQDTSVSLMAAIQQVTAPRLAAVARDAELAALFRGAASVEVRAAGSLHDLAVSGLVSSEAGDVAVRSRWLGLEQIHATLETGSLRLGRVREGLPASPLAAVVRTSAKLPRGSGPLALSVQAEASLAGELLPDVTFRGELGAGALRGAELKLAGAGIDLSARGQLDRHGEARVQARADVEVAAALRLLGSLLGPSAPKDPGIRGKVGVSVDSRRSARGVWSGSAALGASRLELADVQLRGVNAEVSLVDAEPSPRLRALGRWSAVRRGSVSLSPGRLRISGAGERYGFELSGGVEQLGTMTASGVLVRRGERARLSVDAAGTFRGAPWQLDVQPALIIGTSEIEIPGATLWFAGQRLKVRGRYSPSASRVAVEFADSELHRVLQPFGISPELRAVTSGRLSAGGTIERPELDLELRASGVGLRLGPKLEGELRATLSGRSGAFEVRSHFREEGPRQVPRLDVAVGVHGRSRPRASLAQVWREAELGASVQLWRLDSEFVRDLTRRALPVAFDLRGSLFLLRQSGVTQLRSSIDGGLGASPGVPPAKLPTIELRVDVQQRAGEQPRGWLEFGLDGATLPDAADSGCTAGVLASRGSARFDGGRGQAELTVHSGATQLLRVEARGAIPAASVLRGELATFSDLVIAMDAHRLPLARLPFVCRRVRGELTTSTRIVDPLGARPRADIALALGGFSLGSGETVDIDANLGLERGVLKLGGSVVSDGRRSSVRGEMPWSGSDELLRPPASPIELSVQLDRLPLGPFIPNDLPISHVSGFISGKLRARGTSAAPRVSGELRLEDAALTVTELAQSMRDVNGSLLIAGDTLHVKRLSLRDGDGELGISGKIQVTSPDQIRAALDLRARKFPWRQGAQIIATTNAAAHLEATLGAVRREVSVRLRDFDTWLESGKAPSGLALDPHPDVRVSGVDAGAFEPRPGEPPSLPALSILIDAGEEFWVRRADFAVKLAANLQIVTGARAPESGEPEVNVTGQLRFDRGYLELLGKMFEVERGGKLLFQGGRAATLDLAATYQDRRTDKVVKVRLGGSAAAPQLDFQLDGENVGAGEAFNAIYGSDTSSDEEQDAEAQAKNFVSAITAGVISSGIRRRFGSMAPIVMVDPTDDQGNGAVRAGFELDELIPGFLRNVVTGVYVEGIISSETQNDESGQREVEQSVLVELHFPHNLVTSGRYGSNTSWSVDVGWQP